MLAFCSNKDFFKSPFIQQRLEESGVCCYHGDRMAMTPETTFLSTFQTMECSDSCPHTHLYKVCLSITDHYYKKTLWWTAGKIKLHIPRSDTLFKAGLESILTWHSRQCTTQPCDSSIKPDNNGPLVTNAHSEKKVKYQFDLRNIHSLTEYHLIWSYKIYAIP